MDPASSFPNTGSGAALARKRRGSRWVRWLLAGYAFFYFGFAAILWCFADVTWWGTVLLFSPRYVLVWPLCVPAGILLFGTRRQRVVALLVLLVGLFPVCQVCLPWGRLWHRPTKPLRVLTLNAADIPEGSQAFEELVRSASPDIVFVQWENAPREIDWPSGWSTCAAGEFVIASRFPVDSMATSLRNVPGRWPKILVLFATVHAPSGAVRVGTTHLPSPRLGLSGIASRRTVLDLSKRGAIEEEIEWRRSESNRVAEAVALQGDDLILAGDFNMPVDSHIYRAQWGRLGNAFSQAGFGIGNTVRVTQGNFHFSARIDHVLFTRQWRCTRCWVGPDVGSEHRPVIAELQRMEAGL